MANSNRFILFKCFFLKDPFTTKEKFSLKKWIWKYIVLIILFIFTSILATNYFINLWKINKDGVYVLGRIYETSEYRMGTLCEKHEYFYKHHRYLGQACGTFEHAGELIFI